ncbi:hypothetical protein [Paragemmobacter ruber]|uniref:Uncharacterized protein n=1 Tax=Paragemmobacter ruber TaxID=1985673 RepID=A0ABW9Y7S7_9RHOB|nr:hypothetical protein [Rhodobacter ruber]NBE08573.1 hypothetical protein [Rhodobacter ruber]
MPKVEISEALLREIAQEICRVAETLPVGSMERHRIERLLCNDSVMVEAYIKSNLRKANAKDG